MQICRPWRKHVQSFKKISIELFEELQSQGTYCLYTRGKKMQKSQSRKKVTKINAKIISKAHAHLQNYGENMCKVIKRLV